MDDAEKINELRKANPAEAKKCKVRATPTVLINGLKMTNRTLEGYKARMGQILKKESATAETIGIGRGESRRRISGVIRSRGE